MATKPKFPYRSSDDKAVEAAQQVLKSRYHNDVRGMAGEILREAAEQFEDYEDAQEFIQDKIHESADGSAMVIYTAQALNVLVQSDNWQAVDEHGSGDEYNGNLPQFVTVAAYYALRADLEEYIEAMYDDYFPDED